jgi:hypothetical protein
LDRDDLDVGGDIVLTAKIEHFLRLFDIRRSANPKGCVGP